METVAARTDSGGIRAFSEGRAEGGAPGVGFNPADVTEALADLALVVQVMNSAIAVYWQATAAQT